MEVTKKKYGLMTGLAMIIGSVIGCGVFIKAGAVLNASGGNLFVSLLAWLVGGIIMVASGFCFAVYANKVEKFNGCVDYIEYASNKTIGYYFGYYLGMICFPIIGSHVAIIGGHYLVRCFTDNPDLYSYTSYPVIIVAFLLITIFFLINYLAPKISMKYQVSVLFVKVAPILFVAVLGIVAPLFDSSCPGIIGAFKENATTRTGVVSFGEAVKITAFAYDGWIAAAALNAEMKDSKKNLPRAIIGGTIALIIFYLIYFIGLSAVIGNQNVLDKDTLSAAFLFNKIFGLGGAAVFTVLIFLSCTGNVNSKILCTSRSLIALGVRNEGFMPKKMCAVKNDKFSATPYIFSYCLMLFYLLIWWLAYKQFPVFKYLETMDEIVCAIVYGVYIVVYIYIIRNFKEEGVIKRYIMPIIAILGASFFFICGMGLYQLIVDKKVESLISFGAFAVFAFIIFIPAIIVHLRKKK